MNCSSPRRERSSSGVFLPALVTALVSILVVMTLMNVVMPAQAQANAGKRILETIGVSIAVGTVLGASTLPFYDQPGKHLMNLAYGASFGAVVGLGVLIYGVAEGLSQGEPQDGIEGAGYGTGPQRGPQALQRIPSTSIGDTRQSRPFGARVASFRVDPSSVWLPLVSLTW